jgi:hypothetical protein
MMSKIPNLKLIIYRFEKKKNVEQKFREKCMDLMDLAENSTNISNYQTADGSN